MINNVPEQYELDHSLGFAHIFEPNQTIMRAYAPNITVDSPTGIDAGNLRTKYN